MSPALDEIEEPRRREPIFNMPAVVTVTAILLLALFAVYSLLPERMQVQMLLDFAFIPARFGGLPAELAALTDQSVGWTLMTMVTHTGLHGGMFHVIFNVAWLLAFGTIVARVTGTFGYIAIFVIGAMAGAVIFWAVHPSQVVPVVGASGAISGLMGAASRFFFGPRMARLVDPKLLAFAGVWLVVNLVFGLFGFEVGGERGQIAWEAHMGGFFAGLLIVPLFVRRR